MTTTRQKLRHPIFWRRSLYDSLVRRYKARRASDLFVTSWHGDVIRLCGDPVMRYVGQENEDRHIRNNAVGVEIPR